MFPTCCECLASGKLISMRDDSLGSYTITTIIANLSGDVTDRAKRYQAMRDYNEPSEARKFQALSDEYAEELGRRTQ